MRTNKVYSDVMANYCLSFACDKTSKHYNKEVDKLQIEIDNLYHKISKIREKQITKIRPLIKMAMKANKTS